MKKTDILTQNDDNPEERTNVTDFVPRLITGGKDGTTENNWLANMKKGTVFQATAKKDFRNYAVLMLQIYNQTTKATLLHENFADKFFGWVSNERFCTEFNLLEIIFVPEGDWPLVETKQIDNLVKDEENIDNGPRE